MSLNLFGFISPLIDSEYMSQFKKVSTDGIEFKPSIGYMSYTYEKLEEIIVNTIDINVIKSDTKVFISDRDTGSVNIYV